MDIWQLLFSFEGRINRARFWGGMGILLLWGLVSALVVYLLRRHFGETVGSIVNAIASIVSIVPSIALPAKRLHDRDRSGWWQLLPYGPILLLIPALLFQIVPLFVAACVGGFAVALWIFIEIGCLRGTVGPNRFGPDPLGEMQAVAA